MQLAAHVSDAEVQHVRNMLTLVGQLGHHLTGLPLLTSVTLLTA